MDFVGEIDKLFQSLDANPEVKAAVLISKKVAAINEACLGAGTEIALACHARVASDKNLEEDFERHFVFISLYPKDGLFIVDSANLFLFSF